MKRIISLMLALSLFAGGLCGCGNTTETKDPASTTATDETVEIETTTPPEETRELITEEVTEQPTEQPTETERQTMGSISLEQLQPAEYPVFCIAYEDGSFDFYYGEGSYKYESYSSSHFYGMYAYDRYAEELPVIGDDTKMVLFCKKDFSLAVYPVRTVVNVVSYNYGFGEFHSNGYSLDVHYPNGKYESVRLKTIDGEPVEQYEPIIYEETVNPYSGMTSKTVRYIYEGFQNVDSVTLGVVNGTQIEEEECAVDAKFYSCAQDRNNYYEEDSYYVKWAPTVEGYAKLDFSEIPEGQYVMRICYYDEGTVYRVWLVTIEH